jgi:hypothetical protein
VAEECKTHISLLIKGDILFIHDLHQMCMGHESNCVQDILYCMGNTDDTITSMHFCRFCKYWWTTHLYFQIICILKIYLTCWFQCSYYFPNINVILHEHAVPSWYLAILCQHCVDGLLGFVLTYLLYHFMHRDVWHWTIK